MYLLSLKQGITLVLKSSSLRVLKSISSKRIAYNLVMPKDYLYFQII